MKIFFVAMAAAGCNAVQVLKLEAEMLSCSSCAPVRNAESFSCGHPDEPLFAHYNLEMSSQEKFCNENCMVIANESDLSCESNREISLLEVSNLEHMLSTCAPPQECNCICGCEETVYGSAPAPGPPSVPGLTVGPQPVHVGKPKR